MPVKLSVTQRSLLAGVVAAALLIASFLLGAGQGSASASGNASGGTAGSRTGAGRITVTGTGTGSGTPDQLTLSMGVQTSGGSVAGALQQANRAVRTVTAALARRGVRAPDVQTSGLSIQPQYGNSPVPDGYSVSESIQVTLRDLSVAGSQISAAARAGGNATVVDGVSLSMNDTGALMSSARIRAVRNARAKAAQEARARGRVLGPVISVSEAAPAQPLPEYPMAAAGSRSSVPVSPGTQQLSVTVTAVFALA